jgi:hypothetical protein
MNLLSHLLRLSNDRTPHHHWREFLLGAWPTVSGAQFKEVKSLLAVGCSIRFSFRRQFPQILKDKSDKAISQDWWRRFWSATRQVNTNNKRSASPTTRILWPWIALSCYPTAFRRADIRAEQAVIYWTLLSSRRVVAIHGERTCCQHTTLEMHITAHIVLGCLPLGFGVQLASRPAFVPRCTHASTH